MISKGVANINFKNGSSTTIETTKKLKSEANYQTNISQEAQSKKINKMVSP